MRKILKEDVIEAIEQPENMLKKGGKRYSQKTFRKGRIEVVCEEATDQLKVITAYWV